MMNAERSPAPSAARQVLKPHVEERAIEAGEPCPESNRIRIFRWFFSISCLQVFMYFLVPALQFPSQVVFHIEVISALTLGNVVVVFFLLANVGGIIIDRARRSLYTGLLAVICLWLGLVAVTWNNLERWAFLLR